MSVKKRYGNPRPTKSETKTTLLFQLPEVVERQNRGELTDFQLGIFTRRCADAGITVETLRESGLNA